VDLFTCQNWVEKANRRQQKRYSTKKEGFLFISLTDIAKDAQVDSWSPAPYHITIDAV
jgi:hypothetical protein